MGRKGSAPAGYRRWTAGGDDNGEGCNEPVPKGYVPMLVGAGRERERVLIHRKHFGHPCFAVLLEMAANEFGYEQQGILKIPCDIEYFWRVVDRVSKDV